MGHRLPMTATGRSLPVGRGSHLLELRGCCRVRNWPYGSDVAALTCCMSPCRSYTTHRSISLPLATL